MGETGFFVSEKRRAVWNIELDMLEVLKDICERHGLRYFAEGGTLIGAVRHRGFIPWDDDIDVVMLRPDYDRFIEIAKTELPEGFFLQIPETENDYFYGHAKIRKDNTTAIRYIQYPERYEHHQGVFIDIFPVDNIPDGKLAHRIHKFIVLKMMQIIYYAKYYYRLNEHTLKTRVKHKLCTLLLPTNKAVKRFFCRFEKWVRKPNKKRTRMIGLTSTYYHMEDRFAWPLEWFNACMQAEFEHTTISIPVEYDQILQKEYGEYKKPVVGTSLHGEVFFDLEHDYREYISGERSFQEKDLEL